MAHFKFHLRFGLLILLMAGLFAVPVTMVLNKKEKDLPQAPQAAKSASPPIPGEWVVVECQKQQVMRCPHALQADGQTPSYPPPQTVTYRGRCRDISIQIDTFCPR